jgi:myo-inositol 2-dehydrogenase/D-chiro-inositol 1-dehydrogenase
MAFARFTLGSGIPCYVEVSRVSGGRICRVEVVGNGGQLVADVDQSVLTQIEARNVIDREVIPDHPTILTVMEEFARSLSRGTPVPVTGEDGLQALAMAESCYRSAREGRQVAVPAYAS